jgi:hypothetical protein
VGGRRTDVSKLFVARKNVDGQVLPYLKSGRRHRNRRAPASTCSSRSLPTCVRTACALAHAAAW